jgi:alanyl-tRNA synthetase
VGRLVRGKLEVGQAVTATVDSDRRDAIRRHHTATHLLHAALRDELGEHVRQSGSLVAPERLRFDFSHHEMIDPEALARIEDQVNRWVMADLPVDVEHMKLEVARESGAIALFGEKYGETVRTVCVGDLSLELCGGTHCSRTGEIGSLRILAESSIAAGTRRIEAVAGMAAVHHGRQADEMLRELSQDLNCPVEEIAERVQAQHERSRQLEKDLAGAREARASVNVPDLVAQAQQVGPAKLVVQTIADADREMLKALADEVVARSDRGIALLHSHAEAKGVIVAKVSDDLIPQGAHAGELVKAVSGLVGGGGGGTASFAQGGGGKGIELETKWAEIATIVGNQLCEHEEEE